MSWSSLHAFYHADRSATDRLLTEGLLPVVDGLARQKLVDAWFFVRYWEGGPHVRVRLRGEAAAAGTVEESLRAYLRSAPPGESLDPRAYYAAVGGERDAVERHGWFDDRAVVPIAYTPEAERYGGPEGMAISEELFCDSSRVALAALRAAPDPQKRLLLAVQLLLATVEAFGLSDLEAVGWIRAQVNLWPQIGPVSHEQAWRACNSAEREFVTKEERWLKLRAAERSPIVAFWAERVRAAAARYRAANDEGRLTVPPPIVMWSQLHMLNNRLGLTVAEECYYEWLTSLILARPHRHVSFAEDTTSAYDRLYHEQSKLFPYLLGEQMAQAARPDPAPPPTAQTGPLAARLSLPRPQPSSGAVAELARVLRARRSSFAGYGGRLGREDLALLLELAVGRLPAERMDLGDGRYLERKRRTYPSAGGRYPILTYVFPRDVEGIPPALYWYDPDGHALVRIGAAPPIDTLLLSSQMTSTLDEKTPVPVQARDAPLWLFPVADLTYQRQRYGLRSYRLVLAECGHIAQNVVLCATALGLPAITIGGFFDDLLSHTLSLDGVNRAALYMIPLGGRHD